MSAVLPSISGIQARKAFQKNGWLFVRQCGSHMILIKNGHDVTLSIPNHKSLKKPLLKRLIKDASLSVDEFVNLLKS